MALVRSGWFTCSLKPVMPHLLEKMSNVKKTHAWFWFCCWTSISSGLDEEDRSTSDFIFDFLCTLVAAYIAYISHTTGTQKSVYRPVCVHLKMLYSDYTEGHYQPVNVQCVGEKNRERGPNPVRLKAPTRSISTTKHPFTYVLSPDPWPVCFMIH